MNVAEGIARVPRSWVTVLDACKLSSLGRTKIFELIQAGVLKSTKVGSGRLVSVASIRALGQQAGQHE